ncbi:MAG TPA: plastocyanin/azurin family copper-binding protein [Ktedonobacterales bacterium]|nr:plastocyanin/azurin family copper-binding protein [Ktedonobacterales bacterium]
MNNLTLTKARGIPWWSGILLAGILLLAGCGTTTSGGTNANTATAPTSTAAPAGTTSYNSSVAQVKISETNDKYGFAPATLTVAKGTRVEWSNASDAPHTVTSDSGTTLASNIISPSGGTFDFTFTQPGTYTYHCTVHPYMKGSIVVTG